MIMNNILHLIEKLTSDTSDRDDLICMLSLVCLISILSNRTPGNIVQTETTANPLQSLLNQLTDKTDRPGPSVETLMSLLPLLSNSQSKSQPNAGSLSAILGLLNNLNSGGSHEKVTAAKQESPAAAKET